ncbi:hypothetical protein IJT93_09475, partial [bacterium]|nr:hypothetical protein [bacterium]
LFCSEASVRAPVTASAERSAKQNRHSKNMQNMLERFFAAFSMAEKHLQALVKQANVPFSAIFCLNFMTLQKDRFRAILSFLESARRRLLNL